MLARLVVATALAFSLHAAQAQPFSFGLWGDMPYQKAGDTPKIPSSSHLKRAEAGGITIHFNNIADALVNSW